MKIGHLFFYPMLSLLSCVEDYPPPVSNEDVNFLVVDGFINSTEGVVEVKLTRALPLASENPFPTELNAILHIEDGDGVLYTLNSVGDGTYRNDNFIINNDQQYRLKIRRSDGREYFSEYVGMKSTPPIDSLGWRTNQLRDGFEILVNTHDNANNTWYYQWTFEETYEYTSAFLSLYKYENDTIVDIPPSEYLYKCWRTIPSQKIIIGSSEQLSTDIISNFVVNEIPVGSQKLITKYSILVKQRSLTEEAYTYWLNLQKTTEQLGGLFDPQPGRVKGNIFRKDNPDEPVIGYFDIATIQKKRMFIQGNELPTGLRSNKELMGCTLDSASLAEVGTIGQIQGLSLVSPIMQGISIIGYLYAPDFCTDCRLQGGTLTKPLFWE